MNISDFVNYQVASSQNPHPLYGYAHGPIIDPNEGWVPQRRFGGLSPDLFRGMDPRLVREVDPAFFSGLYTEASGSRDEKITTAHVIEGMGVNPPARRMLKLNSTNSLVCDIAVEGHTMCGECFASQDEYREHLSATHPGATVPFGDHVGSPPYHIGMAPGPFGDHVGSPPYHIVVGREPFGDHVGSPPYHIVVGREPFGDHVGPPPYHIVAAPGPFRDQSGSPPYHINGTRALQKWVLGGGWRNASSRSEPFRGGENSLIGEYCDFLEQAARENPSFARQWGTKFHRPSVHAYEEMLSELQPGEGDSQ